MISRLVLSLRESADRPFDVDDFISEELSFSSNPSLPVHTRSGLEFSRFLANGTSISSEAR